MRVPVWLFVVNANEPLLKFIGRLARLQFDISICLIILLNKNLHAMLSDGWSPGVFLDFRVEPLLFPNKLLQPSRCGK